MNKVIPSNGVTVTIARNDNKLWVWCGHFHTCGKSQRSAVGHVQGIEIDPEARRVARENIKLNKVDEIEVPESLIEEVRGQYDVVVANIIDGVLINIKAELLRVLKPGGHLLLKGILEERDNHFFEKFIENSNLTVIRRLEKDEWVGYWVQANISETSPEALH